VPALYKNRHHLRPSCLQWYCIKLMNTISP
jgi:hypothetical protein